MLRWVWLLVLVGCGSGNAWSDADTKSATDAVHAQLTIERMCADNDAGTCKASQIRALERMSYCSNASMLYRHKQGVPDGGINCTP